MGGVGVWDLLITQEGFPSPGLENEGHLAIHPQPARWSAEPRGAPCRRACVPQDGILGLG